jgi:hypothetical protein
VFVCVCVLIICVCEGKGKGKGSNIYLADVTGGDSGDRENVAVNTSLSDCVALTRMPPALLPVASHSRLYRSC